PGGGKVVVRAENLSMTQALINADTEDQDGLGVDIDVRRNMVLKEGFGVSASSLGSGKAGNIDIHTGSLEIYSAAGVGGASFSALDGTSGQIRIQAESILIDGLTAEGVGSASTGIFNGTATHADAGNIILNTDLLELKHGAEIDAKTLPNILSSDSTGNG